MPHRHENCAALCSSENLNRALLHNSKTMATRWTPYYIILDPSLGKCKCFASPDTGQCVSKSQLQPRCNIGSSPMWDQESTVILIPRGDGSLEGILTPSSVEFSKRVLTGKLSYCKPPTSLQNNVF